MVGHLDSHRHPVANACTTEMQVTSLILSPDHQHHTVHRQERSLDGLGTRLSPSAHLTMVHSCISSDEWLWEIL